MSAVFLSYRRDDSAAICGRLYDRLVGFFGRDVIFKDVDSIPLGTDFEQYIGAFIQRSAAQLVVIGPRWLTIADAAGRRRLDDPRDVVRLEVEMALRRGIAVIPVLVMGATMPAAEQLPPGLRPLAALPPVRIRLDPDFDGDVWQLAQLLGRWIPPAVTARPAQPQWGGPQQAYAAPPQRGYAAMPQHSYAAVPVVPPSYAPPMPPAPPAAVPGALAAEVARRRKRRIWPVLAVALAIVVVVAGVGVAYFARQSSRTPYFGTAALTALAATRDGTVWAVGYGGTIVHFDGAEWLQDPSPTRADLLALTMTPDGSSGWAVGVGGTIVGYTHGKWSLYPQSVTGEQLNGVSVLPDGSAGWAVGKNGVILRYADGRWDLLPGAVAGSTLYSVAAVSPTDAWLVVDDVSLMRYNGSAWQSVAVDTTDLTGIQRVQMTSPTDGWATGFDKLWHYDGTTWHDVAVPLPDQESLFGVAMTSPTDGWVVGDGAILRDSRGTWSVFSRQYKNDQLRDIVMTSPSDGWIVDFDSRSILRFANGAWSTYVKGQ